jgi:hypothetical protein
VLESGNGFLSNPFAFAVRAGPPGLPVEAEELVEDSGTFKSERDGRELGHREHLAWEQSSS